MKDSASSQPAGATAKGCSPQWLVVAALVIAAAFAAAHVLGLRDNISILSGTVPATLGSRQLWALLGLVYLVLYASAVLIVPTLVTAAGMLAAVGMLRR